MSVGKKNHLRNATTRIDCKGTPHSIKLSNMATTPARPKSTPHPARASLRVLLGGMLGMAVAMGLGRFVFTPIIPLMQRDLGLTHGLAGWLAGLNYLGYLIGALLCSFMPHLVRHRLVGLSALLVTIAGTALMALAQTGWEWGLLRLAAGIASAMLFIIISVEVAEALGRRGHIHWIGALYGGIGFGIAAPHAKIPSVTQFVMALGICPEGIAYDSMDGKPVHIVVMIAGPDGQQDQYLRILAKVTLLLRNEEMRGRLLESEPEAALEMFKTG